MYHNIDTKYYTVTLALRKTKPQTIMLNSLYHRTKRHSYYLLDTITFEYLMS